MPTPNRSARLLALFVLAVASVTFASGTPNQPDKKIDPKKTKNTSENWVYFGVDPCEFACYDSPFALVVDYNALDKDMAISVKHPGGTDTKDAPQDMNQLTFTLDYDLDTTDMDITIELHPKSNPKDIKATTTRYHLCVLGKGMGMGAHAVKRVTNDLAKGVKPGDPVPAGCHTGEFPAVEKLFAGAQVRFWVQGRFKTGPAKMEYDRPATVTWFKNANGKYVPKWSALLGSPLKAEPLKPNGEVPKTFVLVALLNAEGRVVMVRPYKYWE